VTKYRMEYEYIIHGGWGREEYPGDAIKFISWWPLTDIEQVAEDAGQDLWDNDGWEMHWPITIEIFFEGKSRGVFLVEMEAQPNFYATEKKI